MRVPEKVEALTDQVAWFLDYLQGERAASTHTVAAYERDLNEIAAQFAKNGGSDWKDFGMPDSSAMRASFGRRGLAASTIQRKTAALRSFLRFLASRSQWENGRLPDTGGMRKAKSLPKALTSDELAALLSGPDLNEPAGLRDRTLLELLYGAGLRVTELVELRMEHYMATESLLRIHGKRGKTRIIPIPAETHDWLRRYLDEARASLSGKAATSAVFLNRRGLPLSRSGVFRIIREYAKSAGIKTDVSPHTLRHTYAVHLVQAGADLRSVQELLGHSSVATTEVYTHLDMETVKRKYQTAHPRAKKPT